MVNLRSVGSKYWVGDREKVDSGDVLAIRATTIGCRCARVICTYWLELRNPDLVALPEPPTRNPTERRYSPRTCIEHQIILSRAELLQSTSPGNHKDPTATKVSSSGFS